MSVFRTTVKSLVVSAAAFLLGTAAVAQPANTGEVLPQAHKSLDCASCHGTDTTNIPPNDACLKCHGPMEKLIASPGSTHPIPITRRTGVKAFLAVRATSNTRSRRSTARPATRTKITALVNFDHPEGVAGTAAPSP